MESKKFLVTGGAGFFGSILVHQLLQAGHEVVCFDLNEISLSHKRLTSIQGDIRDSAKVALACEGVDTIHHNVAQVPIAKDAELFHSVNLGGSRILAHQAKIAGVRSLVYTSSSAVFGVPSRNPVTEQTVPSPAESYGRAKYEAENIFSSLSENNIDVSIVRPRTILGIGRLGIFQILFEWIYQDKNIPVLGNGDNVYQFIHAADLASACIAAGEIKGFQCYNIGAKEFCSMRETLQGLIEYAASKSRIVGVNKKIAKLGMNFTSAVGLSPLGSYHSLMYGESMYFDITKAENDLGFSPVYSNIELFKDSYDWYTSNRDGILSGSVSGSGHQSKLSQGILAMIPSLLVW